jgi:zinc transport system permease protein
MALATVLNMSEELFLIMPVCIVCAIILLGIGENKKIGGDAALAMLSVGSLAIGYILLNLFPASSNVAGDVCSSLFGSSSILTLNKNDMLISIVMGIAVIGVFIFFYNKIFSITFDPSFMQASGANARAYNLLLAVVCAVVISISMRLVGSLLVSALIIFPAICAMSLKKSFRSVILCSAAIGVTCALIGMTLSILFGTPTGATIVAADTLAFVLCKGIARLRRSR